MQTKARRSTMRTYGNRLVRFFELIPFLTISKFGKNYKLLGMVSFLDMTFAFDKKHCYKIWSFTVICFKYYFCPNPTKNEITVYILYKPF